MSFFKDLKDDIAQSMNELSESFDEGFLKDAAGENVVPDDGGANTNVDLEVPVGELVTDFDGYAQGQDMEANAEVSSIKDFEFAENMDVLPDLVTEENSDGFLTVPADIEPELTPANVQDEDSTLTTDAVMADDTEMLDFANAFAATDDTGLSDDVSMTDAPDVAEPENIMADMDLSTFAEVADNTALQPEIEVQEENMNIPEEEINMDTINEEFVMPEAEVAEVQTVDNSEPEVTVITKGTTINGGIKSDTSLVVKGTIEGDVECDGKLTITGRVSGNTIASEIYVNTPRLEGDIESKGIVKIDVGTVVIGNVSCTSVLVSGAVKGNIEVNGPVIIDSTAVVKGDIKAKSIQINSGAIVDGHCSLQYADIDVDSFFE